MYIKSIELKDYRNYKEIYVEFSSRVNIFLGNNAQGKTNLLESIYMNAMAKSFKNTRDKDIIRFGQEYCRIKSVIVTEDDEEETEIVITSDGRKSVKLNGIKAHKTSEMLDRIFIVVFSPDDLKIVKEDPEKRRRFIDRELCLIKPGYYNDLNNYKKALIQRNTLIKEKETDMIMLEIFDSELAKYGVRILKKRREFVSKIDKISREIHEKISGGKEHLELRYETNIEIPEEAGYDEAEKIYLQALADSRESDISNRNTSRGPHRDDMKISADGIDLRKFGSQGQQRTAALSLKLSEIKIIEEETGEKPILLLDDVLSELDNDRQTYLINSLGENQMFITTTDIVVKVARSVPEGKIYNIKNGEIEIEI